MISQLRRLYRICEMRKGPDDDFWEILAIPRQEDALNGNLILKDQKPGQIGLSKKRAAQMRSVDFGT